MTVFDEERVYVLYWYRVPHTLQTLASLSIDADKTGQEELSVHKLVEHKA